MASLLRGRRLITKDGSRAPEGALNGKVVLLYFSASWCGPCHQFTPILKDFYDEICDQPDANFEIVYVPGDRSVPEMMEYYQHEHADYLALDMGDSAFIQHLNQRYSVRGIPFCVVIQPDGTVIDGDARSSVQSGGPSAAFRRWRAAWRGGTTVTIQGLVGAAQHNGKTGTLLSFDGAKGRYVVALGGDAQLAVKPGNVALQELILGENVAVHGLQWAPQHNGKRGVVVGAADPTSGRYAVQIDGEPADKALGLKIGNLELVEAANARAAGGGGAATAGGGGGRGGGAAKKSGLPNIQVRNTSGRPL
jgi:nucleoredoxin